MPPELEEIYALLLRHFPTRLEQKEKDAYAKALRVKNNWIWQEQIQLWWGWAHVVFNRYNAHMKEFPKSYYFTNEWEGVTADALEKECLRAWSFRPTLLLNEKKV